jgi:hypothetical protein
MLKIVWYPCFYDMRILSVLCAVNVSHMLLCGSCTFITFSLLTIYLYTL